MHECDYIVVGAGSAGCLLANRLSVDPGAKVVLLEAGGSDRDLLIKIPLLAAVNYFRTGLSWNYVSEPQYGLQGQRLPMPRGKLLGGTSSINGMMYNRGHRWDYDEWSRAGLSDWSYEKVLPAFKSFERNLSHPDGDEYHGRGGELTTVQSEGLNPLYRAWLAAGQAAGFNLTDDINGAQPEGFGLADFNIYRGRRVSASAAFLSPVRQRSNLEIITRAQATSLGFEGGRCVAVNYRKGSRTYTLRARREIILCAGVFNSPQLLQLSGIGDPDHLRSLGIRVVVESREVGRNFQDHVGLFVEWRCTQPVSLYSFYRPDRFLRIMAQVALFGTGPAAAIPLEAQANLRTHADLPAPDVQLTFVPGLSLATTRKGQREHGFLTSVCLLRPKSRGEVLLKSADPFEAPSIQPNYLTDEEDIFGLRDGFKLSRRIVGQSPLAPFRGPELAPGDAVRSDDDIAAWIPKAASTLWHGSSTCRMGADKGSVVDERLRVRGVDGLRVADASVMPAIVGGNTSVPAMMIAEKCAEYITRYSG